jgi:hypothetical protein
MNAEMYEPQMNTDKHRLFFRLYDTIQMVLGGGVGGQSRVHLCLSVAKCREAGNLKTAFIRVPPRLKP